MRTITPSIWQFNSLLHLNTSVPCSAKKLTIKIEKVKNHVAPSVISIMECEKHKTVKKELGTNSFTDILVSHILGLNIKVPKLALENNIMIVKGNLRNIYRGELPKDVSSDIKVGRFTIAADEIIKNNWNKLISEVDLKKEEVKVIEELFVDNRHKEFELKKNIVGFFLSQDLPDIRLATEVQHRAKLLLWSQTGKFTPEEDQMIIDFVEKKGNTWIKLSRLMRRRESVVKLRFELLQSKKENTSGKFKANENEIILLEIFEINQKNMLEGGKISKEDWQEIGKKLNRVPASVDQHWRQVLLPTLKRYHAGTLSTDLKEVLVSHMRENKLNYSQDVDWKQLVKLPQFAGTTPYYLGQMLNKIRSSVQQKHPEISAAEITAETLQWYLDNREPSALKKDENKVIHPVLCGKYFD